MSDKKGNELGNGTLSWIKAEIQRSSVIRFLAYHGAHVGTALIQLHPSLPTDKVAALKKQLSAERAEIFKKRKELAVTANKLAEPWGPLKKSDNLYKDPAKFVSLMLDHFLLFVTYCVHISEFVAPSSLFERTYGSLVEDLIGLPATNEEILDEITFPENLDSITSVQMMLHLAVAYHAYRKDIKKRDMVMTAYLTLHGMELSSDFSLVMWTKAEAMFACEASFIKENKRFSLSFKSLREQEGDKPSADSVRLEKLLQNVLGKSASEDVDPDVVIVNPETGEAIPKGKVPLELHDWSLENLNEDHVALLKKEFGGYMNVTVSSLRVRKTRLEVEYVEGFCDDVGIPTDTYNSAVLGMILANLSHYGALPYIDDNEIKAVESIPETSLITSGRIARWASAAKLLVVAAFHMLSQGVVDGVVPWYESFSQVYGAFVTMGKFKEICSLINETDIMTTFTRTTPFTKLMNNNNVLIYRLTRLSTPDLVIKAVNRARQVGLLDYMDLSGLEDYVKFHKGGIAAQVASGPLKVFCCGNVNPYEPSLITEKVMIADLKPISQAPYHPKLIRQCRCILFTFDDKLNRWYQGNKAWADKDVTDSMFLSLCQQAHETMQEKSEEVMYDKKVLISKLTSVDPSNSELVDKLFKNLYT